MSTAHGSTRILHTSGYRDSQGSGEPLNALGDWGWQAHFETAFAAVAAPDCVPARVIEVQRERIHVVTADGEHAAQVAGRMRQDDAGWWPTVGDWVAARVSADATIVHHVLERKTTLSRKLAGKATREQVLAANVDTVFMVTSCNDDFSPRRIERYLTMIWESGAQPVVLLNKSDLSADPHALATEAEAVALGVPVHAVSAHGDGGLVSLEPYLDPGKTIALLGSSGVGKSTIVNRLLGAQVQDVREVRGGDAKGRHTTTSRHLFRLPGGALVVDTPGLRELGLWFTESGLAEVFTDIEQLATTCRFQDCAHANEPDCAVSAAVDDGRLASERLESYHRLRRELDYLERRADPEAAANTKRRWRTIHKGMRAARKKGWMRDS